MGRLKTWNEMVIGAYYGAEISVVNKNGSYDPSSCWWWSGSGWVYGKLPKHLRRAAARCRRYHYEESNGKRTLSK